MYGIDPLSLKANYDSNNDPSFLIEEDLDEDSEGQNTDDIDDDDDEDIAGFVLIFIYRYYVYA